MTALRKGLKEAIENEQGKTMKAIYLDVCCLNRPFDNQRQERIKLESEAIILIFKHIETNDWHWISSEVVDFEVNKTPNIERKQRIQSLKIFPHRFVLLDDNIIQRADILQNKGFGSYDALHIACAEQGQVELFLTTDDKLLKSAARYQQELKVRIINPLHWLQEVLYEPRNDLS